MIKVAIAWSERDEDKLHLKIVETPVLDWREIFILAREETDLDFNEWIRSLDADLSKSLEVLSCNELNVAIEEIK
jgi:hypothetical protein